MGKSAPAAPDYAGAAEAQGQSSKEVTNMQTWANRPTLNTPWGSQTWSADKQIDPATGQEVTSWTSNINLSPQQQAALDSQMAVQTGRSQAAQDMLGRATDAMGKPIDYSGVSAGADRLDGDYSAWRQKGEDAALAFQAPLQEQRRQSLESQLANMGVTRGSEAWTREMSRLNDQDTRDNLQAFSAGRDEAQFGLDSSLKTGTFNQNLRQQDIAEMYQQRQQPLNELNSLLTGQQVNSPQMPTFTGAGAAQPTQYLTAANNQYQAGLDAYNAESANFSNLLGGATGVAGLFM